MRLPNVRVLLSRTLLLLNALVVSTLFISTIAEAQNQLEFEVSGPIQPGEVVTVGLILDHELPLRTWEVSVCHPGLELLELSFGVGVQFQATFVDQDFFYLEEIGSEAFAASGTFSAPAFYLPITSDREIHRMEFTTDSSGLFGISLCQCQVPQFPFSDFHLLFWQFSEYLLNFLPSG